VSDPTPIPPRPAGAARVLHTSDWHLGVAVRSEPRGPDHDARIAEVVELAARAAPDLIVHTGDLFDGPRPPMTDFGRAIRALRALAEVAPVVVLAGNHDSPVALEVLAMALGDEHPSDVEAGTVEPFAPTTHRIRVHPRPTGAGKGAVSTYATAAGVNLRLVALPFVHANRVLGDFASLADPNATYNDSVRKIVALLTDALREGFDPATDVAVFASHLHVGGAVTSTERAIHVAEHYATEAAHLDPIFGYLAFGHIHVPQVVAGGRGTYAGSLLEVDFGEEGEDKRIVIADLEPGRPTRVTSVPLTAGRRLHRLRAPLAELPDHADGIGDGIVEVTVVAPTDDAVPLDANVIAGERYDTLSDAVRAALPAATLVGVVDARNPHASRAPAAAGTGPVETIEAAFSSWLDDGGAPILAKPSAAQAVPDRVRSLFDELYAGAVAGERTAPAEVDELERLLGAAGLATPAGGG
jgi:exonuclease SbcD